MQSEFWSPGGLDRRALSFTFRSGFVDKLGVYWHHVDPARRPFVFKLGALSKPFGVFLGATMGLLFSPIWRKFWGELRLALGAPSYELPAILIALFVFVLSMFGSS